MCSRPDQNFSKNEAKGDEMYFLIVGEGTRTIRHNLTREMIEAQYQDLISKGKVKIFSIDGEQIEELVEILDDSDKEVFEWEEIRHEY